MEEAPGALEEGTRTMKRPRYKMDMAYLAVLVEQHRGRSSMRAVVKESGLSLSFLSRIENRVGEPSLENLCRLAAWMGIRPGELVEQITMADGRRRCPRCWEEMGTEARARA